MIVSIREEKKTTAITGACIKVIGVGGGGGNAVNSMATSADMSMVSFMIANTDAQALSLSAVQDRIQLGDKVTKGLGAGSNPDVGRRAAEEDIDRVCQLIAGADILFLTAGMGGGTGSGALPVIAHAAREMGILTVAVVTKPFVFEGRRRMKHAEEAIKSLKQSVDTLLIVPNQRLLETVDPRISMLDAFALSNDILKQAIKGISDIIIKPGHINVDFADVRAIMKGMGMALMGVGRMAGENRAREAAIKAISSPLLEDVSIEGARGVLMNITGNTNLGLHEIHDAAQVVYDLVSEDANIILGSVIDPEMGDEIMVTVIATGFEQRETASGEPSAGHRPVQPASSAAYSAAPQPAMHTVAASPAAQNYTHPAARDQYAAPFRPVQPQSQPQIIYRTRDARDLEEAAHDLDTPTFLRRRTEQQQQQQRENLDL